MNCLACGTGCGFRLPPRVCSAAGDIVQNTRFTPYSKLPELHTWRMEEMPPEHFEEHHCLAALYCGVYLRACGGDSSWCKFKSFHQWRT